MLLDGPFPDLYEIFPILAGQEAVAHVEQALWDGNATIDEIAKLGQETISAAGDRPWWVVINLIRSAKSAWDVVHVNDATGKSLAGWLDELWSKIMSYIDPKKKASWVTEIERPPKGTDVEIDFDAEEQAFLNAMNAVMR